MVKPSNQPRVHTKNAFADVTVAADYSQLHYIFLLDAGYIRQKAKLSKVNHFSLKFTKFYYKRAFFGYHVYPCQNHELLGHQLVAS